jgi:uncharacterized membrane protein
MNNIVNEYDFDVLEITKVGWERIKGVKLQFVIAFIIYVVIALGFQLILGFFLPQDNLLNQFIVMILGYPVLMPIMAGVVMMAIRYNRAEEVQFQSVFHYYPLAGKLALAGILIYVFTVIGFMLLIIPGIYLSVAYSFTVPLIVDKNMDVWEAMELSRKTVTKHWFKVAGLMGLLSIIMFISAIPFLIGLVWTVPLFFITMYGLAYSVMFEI